MKKFIAAITAAFLIYSSWAFAPADYRVYAEPGARYSRVLSDNAVLYMDASLTVPWFTLPYSYYVKVLSVSGTSAKVEYKGDNASRPSAKGYVAAEELNFTDEIPSPAYPSLVLTVNQNCMLYKDVDFTIAETVTQNSTIDFYGFLTRKNGEKLIYGYVQTSSGDKYVGYLPLSAVYDFTVPQLPVSEPTSASADDSPPESSSEPDNAVGNNLQILIIVAVSVVAISIVYLLFRPSQSKVKDEVISKSKFYDDE